MNTTKLVNIYLFRLLNSKAFILSIVTYVFLLYITVHTDFLYSEPKITPIYYFLKLAYISSTQGFILVVVSLPSLLSFYEDWTGGIIPFILTRCKKSSYLLSIIISNSIIVFLITFISEFLFVVLIHSKFDFYVENSVLTDNFIETSIGGTFIAEGKIVTFYLYHAFMKTSINLIFSSISILASVKITNQLFTIISPYVLYTILTNILPRFGFPQLLNPDIVFSERDFLFYLSPIKSARVFSFAYPFIYLFFSLMIIFIFLHRLFSYKLYNEGELS